MLVITRRSGESVQIGPDIKIHVLRAEGGQIQLGIEAPKGVLVLRSELVGSSKGKPTP